MIGMVLSIVTYGLIQVSRFENLAAKMPKSTPKRPEIKTLINNLKNEDAKLMIFTF
jgi:hypothetical protein